jgi:hypothetical protein
VRGAVWRDAGGNARPALPPSARVCKAVAHGALRYGRIMSNLRKQLNRHEAPPPNTIAFTAKLSRRRTAAIQ